MEELSSVIGTAQDFLRQLHANNNRDWFQDHKKDYEAAIKNPGNAIGETLGVRLAQLTGREATHKLFRINRDVRFSKDKTPYNTHLHLLWSDGSGPGFFFGISLEYVSAGCGVMGLQKERLDAYRALIDQEGKALAAGIDDLKNKGFRLDEPELKRVPAPYAKDHDSADLLRRKSLAVWNDLDAETVSVEHVFQSFETLMPIYRFCDKIG